MSLVTLFLAVFLIGIVFTIIYLTPLYPAVKAVLYCLLALMVLTWVASLLGYHAPFGMRL